MPVTVVVGDTVIHEALLEPTHPQALEFDGSAVTAMVPVLSDEPSESELWTVKLHVRLS